MLYIGVFFLIQVSVSLVYDTTHCGFVFVCRYFPPSGIFGPGTAAAQVSPAFGPLYFRIVFVCVPVSSRSVFEIRFDANVLTYDDNV